MGKYFFNTTKFGWVDYTAYIRPACLPCSNSSCVAGFLKNKRLLNHDISDEERCKVESKFILELCCLTALHCAGSNKLCQHKAGP